MEASESFHFAHRASGGGRQQYIVVTVTAARAPAERGLTEMVDLCALRSLSRRRS